MVARRAPSRNDDLPAPTKPARRCFTVDEYYRMGKAGILSEDDRVELIEGEIIQMPPIGSDHAGGESFLDTWLIIRIHRRAIVRTQLPVRLGTRSEPVPDIAVLKLRPDFYRQAHPGPDDVYLLIEVADTSLSYDRGRKARLYAAAGIPEYWIVDLRRRRLLVFRDPQDGKYAGVMTVEREGSISPLAFPDVVLQLVELFP